MKREINSTEILYLEADANYTILHFKNGEKIISSYHMAWHAEKLAEHVPLIRPNRKYYVNLNHLKSHDFDVVSIAKLNIPISRRRKEIIQNQILNHQAE